MIAQVVVTNSLNLSTILAVAAVFFAAAAYVVPKVFKLAQQILKEIYDLKAWMTAYQASLLNQQTAQLEACIHQIPGHPEGNNPPINPPIE